jgi:nucleoside 2-deoxyribosyltransferase
MSQLFQEGGSKRKIYLAAPLFSVAEKRFNSELKERLRPWCDVYLPQEDGGLIADMIESGVDSTVARRRIFEMDTAAIDACDLILVVLDGRTIDEGAAFELGYAYARGKACYGLQTDVRRLLQSGNNPMIDSGLIYTFRHVEEVILWAETGRNFETHKMEGMGDEESKTRRAPK